MRQALIFVGGVAGVGKTTFCNELTKIIPDSFMGSFFKLMQRQADLRNWNKDSKLQYWDLLQLSILRDILFLAIKKGKTIILDGHYAFQGEAGPAVAFAKRGFSIQHGASLTYSDVFCDEIGAVDVSVYAVILQASTEVIQERQTRDPRFSLPLGREVIEYEQNMEKLHWQVFCQKLSSKNLTPDQYELENQEILPDLLARQFMQNLL